MIHNPPESRLTRRRALRALAGGSALVLPAPGRAQSAREPFDQWVASFRARALARGVSDTTYMRVMHGLKPDTTVLVPRHQMSEHFPVGFQ
jgi:membrane-bound lytic murein transglycosylase B